MLIRVSPNVTRSAQPLSCSFKVPWDIRPEALERKREEVARTFVRHMAAQGYEFAGKGLRKLFGPKPDLPVTMDVSDKEVLPSHAGDAALAALKTGYVRYEIVGLFLVPDKVEVLE